MKSKFEITVKRMNSYHLGFCKYCSMENVKNKNTKVYKCKYDKAEKQKRREKILKMTNKNYVNKQNAQKYIDKTKKNGIMNLTNNNL